MRNENPCRYCREIRRKCIWEKGDPCCERCSKCNVECVPLSAKDTVISMKDDNQQLSKLWDQIVELEKALAFTKNILVPPSLNTTAMLTPRSSMPTATTVIGNVTPLSASTPEINKQPQWDLTVINGQLQLESKIKDFDELLLYHQASIRYISPFEGLLQRERIQFEGIIPGMSAVASSANLLLRGKVNKIPSQQRQITFDKHLLLPSCSPHTMTTYRDEIDYLVKLYMKHCNPSIGMLHEPSFMDYYRKLKDPLKSPIVLATCIDGIAYLYPQLPYTSIEKRQWGEFFYNKCKDLLFEMYDDRNHRLDVVITTSLLVQYMQSMVMYCSEVRRLITLALLTCTDLIEEQKKLNNKTMSSMERILLERHYMHLQFSDRLLDVYLEGKINFSGIKSCSLELLEGESDEITCYLEAWKSIFALIGSPYMVALMEKISHTLYGEPCEISLNMIMEFEPMLREWWASLPVKFQICNDPFASTTLATVQQTLNKVTTPTMMVPFAALHCLSSIIQSSMLNPSALKNLENDGLIINNNNSMLQIIREKASSLTLISIKMLAYVTRQNLKMNTKLLSLSPGYMMGALHAVCSIVNRNINIQLPSEVLQTLSECFNQIKSSLYENHQFTTSSSSPSPLEIFMAAHNNVDAMDDDVYNNFPFPGYAMTSDVFFTCFHQLEQKFRIVF